jgi:hypothetical protein
MFTESISGRIGIMYLSEFNLIFWSINDLLIVPVTINYLVGSGNNKLELGGGVSYFSLSEGEFLGFETESKTEAGVTGTMVIGYRYQKKGGGFLFRAGFTPFITGKGFYPYGGVSIGFSF